ncbi:PH domain-containing protein [Flavobacterium glaciei]|uniref:PH (Pleckstrin Homology) domain-containing protein n=1 Tax=Flavobacterium glaciei TaxID=386300 RepID=A0A562PJP0_9FLAO|nr:PH domain-containing protein [Flavobacterium glaciei]RDI50354.1 PH (Pleckstrin Homology) domain-containing protein [Flavobacterium glaciei]TWI44637.1 PH (Pleckstrin Homology) domain-containing protein [Flavobacterium glaciei]
MKEQFKKFLNEEQDPKAIEKIASKLSDLLMKNEEIGYIAVQKKPAITVLPDSIVLTNKRIVICQPKNLGLSMNFIDYTWDEIEGTFVKENILGSEFSFTTRTNMEVSIDYIPKIQARKIFTFAKEQLDILKVGSVLNATMMDEVPVSASEEVEIVEEMETEEVISFAEIMPVSQPNFIAENQVFEDVPASPKDKSLSDLSQDELFEKLQNYKKLLDNGLILQGEYDAFKKEILSYM